jgi:hypothetical protein
LRKSLLASIAALNVSLETSSTFGSFCPLIRDRLRLVFVCRSAWFSSENGVLILIPIISRRA